MTVSASVCQFRASTFGYTADDAGGKSIELVVAAEDAAESRHASAAYHGGLSAGRCCSERSEAVEQGRGRLTAGDSPRPGITPQALPDSLAEPMS